MQIELRGILTTPPKIKGPSNIKDMFKYYRYHHENRHETNDCQALKDEVERLIRHGHLREFERGWNALQEQP